MGKARIAGVFYLLTFLTGGFALVSHSRLGIAAGLIAGACYVAVTILFYGLFKPVNATLSLLAALGWLTFLSPTLAQSLYPYNLVPGIVGEGALTLWLLFMGVDVRRWHERADAARFQPQSA